MMTEEQKNKHYFLTSSSSTITFKNGKHLRKLRSPQIPAKTQAVRLFHVKGSRRLVGPERNSDSKLLHVC